MPLQLPAIATTSPISENWGGVSTGFEPFVVATLCQQLFKSEQRPLPVVLAHDTQHMYRLASAITYFDPSIECLLFPEWDTVPYDRVAPSHHIMATRLQTLSRLQDRTEGMQGAEVGKACLLVTPAAFCQKVLTPKMIEGISLTLRVGMQVTHEKVRHYCVHAGYQMVDVVREPGECAIRGSIIDIYPAQAAKPYRLDLFDTEIESIRFFDPLTQMSTDPTEGLVCVPASEVVLTPERAKSFRQGYLQLFGVHAGNDTIAQTIEDGRSFKGMEQWMPLFYEALKPLMTYVTNPLYIIGPHVQNAMTQFLSQAAEHYAERLQNASKGGREQPDAYRPVPLNQFYMTSQDVEKLLSKADTVRLSPFQEEGHLSFGAKPLSLKEGDAILKNASPYERLKSHLEAFQGKTILSAKTPGALAQLTALVDMHLGITLPSPQSWSEITASKTSVLTTVSPLEQGFLYQDIAFLTDVDLFGKALNASKRAHRKKGDVLSLSSFQVGDYLVHREHGVGVFQELTTLMVNGAEHACVQLMYANGDKLYVPVENLDLLSKYATGDSTVVLDRLGAAGWQKRKATAKKRILEIAGKLMDLAAARQTQKGIQIDLFESAYEEFCQRFPYTETDDQLSAIEATITDLADPKPMDRLICGDVGFGKTEVALRAAFVAASAGYQVAVVVPTTILCRQHYQNFAERFAGFGIKVGQLSRFVSPKSTKITLEGLANGEVQIVITTHGIFSKKTKFKNLGLIIVDEEQHFGVLQKEYLKELEPEVNVLAMSATPIPRTLQMAISGVRELSLIATPPIDRLAVKSFVMAFDRMILREAILREYHRGGQVYFVCPRVQDLKKVAEKIKELVPEISMREAHGQMPIQKLDQTMQAFYNREFTVLLATNIVESGLDVPTANTLIVYRADLFGLSQLYQLRGRIGRSKVRGYAYFLLPHDRILQDKATRRLEVMQSLEQLGGGFTVASHDMDIRGAGNLMGAEQSGHIKEVGVELYQQMLQEAIDALQAKRGGGTTSADHDFSPNINVGLSTIIPETYIPDLSLRLSLYRELSAIDTMEELAAMKGQMRDRFGAWPVDVDHLFEVITLKIHARALNIVKIDAGPKGVVFKFYQNQVEKPEKLLQYISTQAGFLKLRPDHTLLLSRLWSSPDARMKGLQQFLTTLKEVLA